MMSNKKEVTWLSLLMLAIFILMMKTTAANAWELIHKKDMQHNQQFEIDIQYANGFSTLNNKTKHLIKQIKRQFLQDIQANKSIPKSAPGKNTLVVRYERAYMEASQKRCGFNPQYCIPKRLSLIYTVSENLKGYAHPKTTIYTLNFLEGQFTDLNKTFRIKADNIKQIQNYIISQLNAEKHADLPWFKKKC
jgi:hypothetical protein